MRWAVLALAGCSEILVPSTSFDESPVPDAPDYAEPRAWAALPDVEDQADRLAAGETDAQATAAVDVFYIHPTTYYSAASWNEPLDDGTNDFTENTMRSQASAFNASARVYAPYYRQVTLGAYLTERTADADQAFDLAYGDVRAAFETYLAQHNAGRPFIVASHSQGSGHGLRLVSEMVSDLAQDASLRDRFVAAYLIGAAIPGDALERTIPGVPLCEAPDQTGCAIFYNTIEAGSRGRRFDSIRVWYPGGNQTVDDPSLLCVNAVTWAADGEESALEDHLGAVQFEEEGVPEPQPEIVTARCDDGLLQIDLRDDDWSQLGGDQHIHDYQLFYMNIRANALARADAFRDLRSP
jgi:hypothetical protein